MIKAALKLPELFPISTVPVLIRPFSSLTFSKEQVHCLLVHMFLGTTAIMGWMKYWSNFTRWLCSDGDISTVYLTVLIDYFEMYQIGLIAGNACVIFERKTYEFDTGNLLCSTNPLIPVHLSVSGKIGETSGEAEIDFANQDIGFGVSATQEEIIFGMSPELAIAMLFVPTIQDDETIYMKGAQLIGLYTGYGTSLKYAGRCTNTNQNWSERIVVAMDALPFDENDLKVQLQDDNLHRELQKCTCGFQDIKVVGTGFWGCGAFNGDRKLKFLIQWISASVAECEKLEFYCFGNELFYQECSHWIDTVHKEGWDIGTAYKFLLKRRVELEEFEEDLF
eukprot:TRINITY_DN1709_c0_g1_i2.p1 TRINITY_DN1709_c0_g1~~TRINITY_DN1709_c0_g1_i2.p1  ORF type:complete len:336 (-),score=66.30 TRINITY_DN1709_c0_g1_i2:1015-2022(-)